MSVVALFFPIVEKIKLNAWWRFNLNVPIPLIFNTYPLSTAPKNVLRADALTAAFIFPVKNLLFKPKVGPTETIS